MTTTATSLHAPLPLHARVHEQRSLRTRPGRRFEPTTERELDSALRHLAARLPGANRGVAVIAEMPGPAGLPDIVAIPRTVQLQLRLEHPCPPLLAWADARLVAAIPRRRSLSIETVARRLNLDARSVRRAARRLVASGALVQTETGSLMRVAELEPVGRIYALEAKVDDWSGGLGQALRYGAWADASGIVLRDLPRDYSRGVSQARALGLGLALGTRWLVRPRMHRLEAARRLWASEHVVAALTGASGSTPAPV